MWEWRKPVIKKKKNAHKHLKGLSIGLDVVTMVGADEWQAKQEDDWRIMIMPPPPTITTTTATPQW